MDNFYTAEICIYSVHLLKLLCKSDYFPSKYRFTTCFIIGIPVQKLQTVRLEGEWWSSLSSDKLDTVVL